MLHRLAESLCPDGRLAPVEAGAGQWEVGEEDAGGSESVPALYSFEQHAVALVALRERVFLARPRT